jgi:hypothetical protein
MRMTERGRLIENRQAISGKKDLSRLGDSFFLKRWTPMPPIPRPSMVRDRIMKT